MADHFHGVSIRTDETIDLRLDRLALALSRPGERATKAYAARAALLRGLDALELEGVEAARPAAMLPPGKRPRRRRAVQHG